MYHYVNITENFAENIAIRVIIFTLLITFVTLIYELWNFLYFLLVCQEFWIEDLQGCIAIVIENVQNYHTNTALQDLKPHDKFFSFVQGLFTSDSHRNVGPSEVQT